MDLVTLADVRTLLGHLPKAFREKLQMYQSGGGSVSGRLSGLPSHGKITLNKGGQNAESIADYYNGAWFDGVGCRSCAKWPRLHAMVSDKSLQRRDADRQLSK
jgi:hypothetical protein